MRPSRANFSLNVFQPAFMFPHGDTPLYYLWYSFIGLERRVYANQALGHDDFSSTGKLDI